MKTIVLKPDLLQVGDEVLFEGERMIYIGSIGNLDTRMILRSPDGNSETLIYPWQFDIKEIDMRPCCGRCEKQVCECAPERNSLYGFIQPVKKQSLCEECGKYVDVTCDGICTLCDHDAVQRIVDAEKKEEEKPPLKLTQEELQLQIEKDAKNGIDINSPNYPYEHVSTCCKYGFGIVVTTYVCKRCGNNCSLTIQEKQKEEVQHEEEKPELKFRERLCVKCNTHPRMTIDGSCFECNSVRMGSLTVEKDTIDPFIRGEKIKVFNRVQDSGFIATVYAYLDPSGMIVERDDDGCKVDVHPQWCVKLKPEGNPFKVGDIVLVYKGESGGWKGKVYEINPDGKTMKVAMEDLNGRFTLHSYIGTYHYKQCERVE